MEVARFIRFVVPMCVGLTSKIAKESRRPSLVDLIVYEINAVFEGAARGKLAHADFITAATASTSKHSDSLNFRVKLNLARHLVSPC